MMLHGLCRLGQDAEVRSTSNGDVVAHLSLAFNHGQKDSNGKRPTQWVKAALWGKRAETLAEYLTKGTALVVSLEDPHIETFDKRDGTQGATLAARVGNLEFAGSPAQAPAPAPRQAPPQRERAPAPAPRPAARAPTGFDDMDDDIPF